MDIPPRVILTPKTTLCCLIYMPLSKSYETFFFSSPVKLVDPWGAVSWSSPSRVFQTTPAQYRKQTGSWGCQHFKTNPGQHQYPLPAVQLRVMLGYASRRPGTLDILKHRLDNQRAHTFSRKPPLRKSKHWDCGTVGYNHYLLAYNCTSKSLQESASKRRKGKRWLFHIIIIIIALQNSWQLELQLCWWPAQFLSPYWSIWNTTTTFLPFWKINQNY